MAGSRKQSGMDKGASGKDGRGGGSPRPNFAATRQRQLAAKRAADERARAIFWFVTAALLLAIFAFPTFVILAVGLAPTWVAILVNNQRSVDRVHCIGACNLAGVMPNLMTLWAGLHSVDHAFHILSDVYAWAVMYLGAAAGVGALWLGPHLAAVAHGVHVTRRRRMLEQYRQRLVEEWGGDIVGATKELNKETNAAKENAA